MVDIIQYTLREGRIYVECAWKTVVLIPNGNGEFCSISIVDVIWKAVFGVVNFRIGLAVDFHDTLHGFRAGRGMGTAYLEVKLTHKLTEMREKVFYKIFLNLQKNYGTLEREHCMEILVRYGIGPYTPRVLRLYWYHLLMVDQAGQYYGVPFPGLSGVTQGDPLSPTIFKMVVDAVIWNWVMQVTGEDPASVGLGWAIQCLTEFFTRMAGSWLCRNRPNFRRNWKF